MAIDNKVAAELLNAPIPGQSLTKSPENTSAWEQPSKYTDVEGALISLFKHIGAPKNLPKVMDLIRKDVPITVITKTLLFSAFGQGAITPDMALLMYQPLAVHLVTLGRLAGIDPVIYPGEYNQLSLEEEIEYFNELSADQVLEIMHGKKATPTQPEPMEQAAMEAPEEDQQMSLLGGGTNGR